MKRMSDQRLVVNPADLSEMRKPSRIFFIVAGLIAIGLLGFLFIRNLIDFPVYYAAGRSLIEGRTDLYSPDFALGRVMDYRYPPFFLVAFLPLWLVRYPIAAYLWYLLAAIELIGCVVIVSKLFPGFRLSKRMWLGVGLGIAQYFVMALHYGNAQVLAVFLLFASLYFAIHKRNVAAALLMSLAITIKLTPVLLLPYFVLKKRWTLVACIAVFMAAINLAPAFYFGPRRNIELLGVWYGHVVASQEFHEDNGPINLSLKGQLRRYLSSVDYSRRVDGDVRYPAVNAASLPRERVEQIWVVGSCVLFVAILALIWASRRRPNGSIGEDNGGESERDPLELALMLCLMLLVGPLTSKIYFIALLWPLACLANIAAGAPTRRARLSLAALGLVAISNVVLPLLPGRPVQRLLLVTGMDFFVNCLLMAALTFELILRRRLSSPRSAELQTPARS